MNLMHMVRREIRHRWLNFLLGVLAVAIAVGSLIAALSVLKSDRDVTASLLAARQTEVADAGSKLEDSMRKITKGLGFNVLVLSKDENLGDLHLNGVPQQSFNESHVERLAESKIVTVNHLLPIVAKRIEWPERECDVILTGTRGEVPIAHRDPKKPLLDHVPAGTMVAGYHIHSGKSGQPAITKGDTVTLMGREFTVTSLHDERGNSDDSTVWINLEEAQQMLGMENLVNAILALECNCAAEDRVAEIRAEIAAILPGTQIVERGPAALARAEARNTAHKTAVANLEEAEAARETLHSQREQLVSLLVPLVVLASLASIGFLAFTNVRQRSSEIGMLQAIGIRKGQIMKVILSRALLVGVSGGILGWMLGIVIGVGYAGMHPGVADPFSFNHGLIALLVAPLLTVIASWIPAVFASSQDPAVVLAGD